MKGGTGRQEEKRIALDNQAKTEDGMQKWREGPLEEYMTGKSPGGRSTNKDKTVSVSQEDSWLATEIGKVFYPPDKWKIVFNQDFLVLFYTCFTYIKFVIMCIYMF